MLRYLVLSLVALPLAACDAPDPASFPKHALRDDASTGSHIAGVGDGLNSTSSTDTHALGRMQGSNGAPGGGK